MKWTSLLAQGWTRIPGAQHQATHENINYSNTYTPIILREDIFEKYN